jgi:hypothetical protein
MGWDGMGTIGGVQLFLVSFLLFLFLFLVSLFVKPYQEPTRAPKSLSTAGGDGASSGGATF